MAAGHHSQGLGNVYPSPGRPSTSFGNAYPRPCYLTPVPREHLPELGEGFPSFETPSPLRREDFPDIGTSLLETLVHGLCCGLEGIKGERRVWFLE